MIRDEVDTTPVDARVSRTKARENTVRSLCLCALLSFRAGEFPAKSETREPGEIIGEYTSYDSMPKFEYDCTVIF